MLTKTTTMVWWYCFLVFLLICTFWGDGNMVTSGDTNCKGPSEWITQKQEVCYGPGSPGPFKLVGNQTLYAIRLVHLHGQFACTGHNEVSARWGCNSTARSCLPDHCHVTHLHREKQTSHVGEQTYKLDMKGYYTIPGFTIDDDVIVFKLADWPTRLSAEGENFEIEALKGNGGKHCVQVDASFIF